MNDLEIRKKVRSGSTGKYNIGDGLYLRISDQGTAFWSVRYSIHNKRREMIVGRYTGGSVGGLSLSEAKFKAAQLKAGVREGIDPLTEKKRSNLVNVKTVSDVAEDWLDAHVARLQHPQIPIRIFRKEIAPSIGELPLVRVTSVDILSIIRTIAASKRPSIANDTLAVCKQIFNHGIKLGLISTNPALVFTNRDAGGLESSRDRILNLGEIEIIFRIFRENSVQFSRENYLALALLMVLGVRKSELIEARWDEFNFNDMEWKLSKNRTKTGSDIIIPIPQTTSVWFEELILRSCGSDYLFPSRKQNSKKPYISADTLNHALSKLFGEKTSPNIKNPKNVLGEAGIKHFVVHDLRRTCRSLLAANGVPPHIAERCLNHKLRGVEAIYDRYDYFEERKAALNHLADQIAPLVNL